MDVSHTATVNRAGCTITQWVLVEGKRIMVAATVQRRFLRKPILRLQVLDGETRH